MKEKNPSVSIIIPCYNEEQFIGKCLDSILSQDYPKEKLEILIVDGRSKDRTREIVQNYCKQYSFVKLLDNPEKFTPSGLNIGIKNAQGEIIIRMDAHAEYNNDYIRKCVENLEEHKVDNVGGIIKTIPSKNTLVAKAIALCLSHPFGTGNSYFRIGSKEPQLVDTVFGGCYRREVFDRIGLFNEKMIRSQDIEFNLRLRDKAGKILLVPDIVSYYYSQSTLLGFLKHNFLDGIWVTYPLKSGIQSFSWRHLTPLFFLLVLGITFLFSFVSWFFLLLFIIVVSWYLTLIIYFSFKIAKREKNIGLLFAMPIVFFCRHFGYGLGSLWGLIKIFLNNGREKTKGS
ncbi:MAG TPA: glycosyltransferase family 2 protein [Candidatus Atribacteria bacterium]|nr:glycosyltransferase family 2 protein [Candidatus Atribacteria bacterium]